MKTEHEIASESIALNEKLADELKAFRAMYEKAAKERDEWKECAYSLNDALNVAGVRCDWLNHSGGYYHTGLQPCPLEKIIADARSKFTALKSRQSTP